MPRSRPVKIVDSERRSSMSLTNTIQNMLLDKTVKLLNKNERTVVHRYAQYCKKRYRYRVDSSFVEFSFIQLRMHVIFTGLGSGILSCDLMHVDNPVNITGFLRCIQRILKVILIYLKLFNNIILLPNVSNSP